MQMKQQSRILIPTPTPIISNKSAYYPCMEAQQKSFPYDTRIGSSGNSFAIWAGVTDFGSPEMIACILTEDCNVTYAS